jgi:hypothetical protein
MGTLAALPDGHEAEPVDAPCPYLWEVRWDPPLSRVCGEGAVGMIMCLYVRWRWRVSACVHPRERGDLVGGTHGTVE